MNFVDRIEEIARLRDALSREKSSLVVVYGRRWLGKSTLIKRVLSDSDVYFLADRSEGQHQRTLLAKVVAQVFPDFDKLTYPDWESLFRAVNYRTDKRFTLCLDEFPYLVEQSPELPSVLQKLVDEKQLKYNLVLCGSSQNMMYGLFLDSTAPLYGRADEIMRLTPIHLPYIQEALNLEAVGAVEEYAVWGGVPRYWELRENRNSLSDALWHNILSVNGTLYEEPIKLFQDDVKNIVKTSTIMSYIGSGANRLSEIAARCNEPATNLSRPLKKLIDLGFLEKDVPFGIDEKDAVTGNMVNGIVYGKAKRWWGSVLNEDKKPEQVEFDVMAESLDKKYLLVGECKWTNQENGKQLTTELLRKANLLPFAKNYTIVPMLLLKNTPKDDIGNAMLPENVVELIK